MNRIRTALALAVASCATVAATAAGAADAAPAPSVSLTPAHVQVTATGDETYSYHAAHLASGSRVALQVHEDSAWTTLAQTAPKQGTVSGGFHITGPGEPGLFHFRAAVVRAGHVRAVSATHRIYAFTTLSLHTLCHGVLDGDCESGTTPVGTGGATFHYTLLAGVNETSDPFTSQLGAARTSCRSLHLRYISDQQGAGTTYLRLRQPGHATQTHTNPSTAVGTFHATLTGGRFDLDVEQDSAGVFMYFAGSASCWTRTGSR